jgi:ring-1,2-phenylacetyl-CoA epoxidase subunit PaaD
MVTGNDISIRRCRESDLEGFRELGSGLHVKHCHREFGRMKNGEVVILVAVDAEDTPVGKVHVDLSARADDGVAVIGSAAVAPSRRRRGIGTALMNSAEALIRSEGLGTAELGVEDANPDTRRLYDRLGYEVVGRTDFSYEVEGPKGAAVEVAHPGSVMRKRLEPSPRDSLREEDIWSALAKIPDPEIPVISLVDLGVIREVEVADAGVRVAFTPTFLGCPAQEAMRDAIAATIRNLGAEPDVDIVLDDAGATDRITPEGREKLRVSGFAPPVPREPGAPTLVQLERGAFRCPYCGSTKTKLENIFGPTPCRSLRYCTSCRQPFEQFKTI